MGDLPLNSKGILPKMFCYILARLTVIKVPLMAIYLYSNQESSLPQLNLEMMDLQMQSFDCSVARETMYD